MLRFNTAGRGVEEEEEEEDCLKKAMPGKAEVSSDGEKGKLRGILEAKATKSLQTPKDTSNRASSERN